MVIALIIIWLIVGLVSYVLKMVLSQKSLDWDDLYLIPFATFNGLLTAIDFIFLYYDYVKISRRLDKELKELETKERLSTQKS